MNIRTELRFALFTRVSTEVQEEKGESLKVQRQQIEAAVKQLGGKIVRRYEGHEHGMSGYDRRNFVQMLGDAESEKFDAICMKDTTRWSRDNRTSKDAIAVFARRGIRFFCLTQEYDLTDPQTLFLLGVLTELAEFSVRQNLQKSAESRVSRAERGFVTSGTPPYGRNVEGTTAVGTARWGYDPVAKELVERAAAFYLAGRTWADVGKVLDQNSETIRRRVLASGSAWTQKFVLKGKTISVVTTIPALLPTDVIDSVRAKSLAHHINRHTPKVYALSRYFRCADCGSVLSVHTHKSGFVWLQHHQKTKGKNCFRGAPYLQLEKSVLGEFGQALKNMGLLQSEWVILGHFRSLEAYK